MMLAKKLIYNYFFYKILKLDMFLLNYSIKTILIEDLTEFRPNELADFFKIYLINAIGILLSS